MPKTIKEFQLNQSTGEVSVEYSDNSTSKFNASDMVTAQTDPVTGRIKKITSGVRDALSDLGVSAVSSRKVVSLKPTGNPTISAAVNVTRHVSYVSPVGFVAYKVRLYNAYSSPIAMSCAVTTQSAVGDGVFNSATWETVTFGGSNTATVPAGSGTAPEFTLGYIDSDVMYTPSAYYGNGTIVAVRTFNALANSTRFDIAGPFNPSSLSGTGMYAAYLLGADGVTTPTAFTGQTVLGTLPNAEVIGYTDSQVARIGLFGSSTLSGQGDTANNGWAWRAQQLMSSSSNAYVFVNHSASGRTTNKGLATALQMIAAGGLDYAVLNVFSTNDTDNTTQAGVNRMIGQMRVFADACAQHGVKPFFATFQSQTGMTGALYANCKAVNAAARLYAAKIGAGVFDLAALLSDETQSVGTWKDVSNTSDGTHPNAVAAPIIAAYAATCFA